MCRLSWNLGASASWNPNGPVQTCNGIALHLLYILHHIKIKRPSCCFALKIFYGLIFNIGVRWERHNKGLMFVPGIIGRSRNNQHYAMMFSIPLLCILAPTCFGRSLPSSGSFLDPSELLEIQIEWVVYHIMCGYVACVPECRGSVCLCFPAECIWYTTYSFCISRTPDGSKKLPDYGRLLPKHVGTSI
jgi:hypothetical protein